MILRTGTGVLAVLLCMAGCSPSPVTHARRSAALEHYREAADLLLPELARRPDDVQLNLEAGICYHRTGRYTVAAELFKRVLQHDAGNDAALYFLGASLEATGAELEALQCYRRYAVESDRHPARLQVAARTRMLQRRMARAWAASAVRQETSPAPVTSRIAVAVGAFQFTGFDESVRPLQTGLAYCIERDLSLISDLIVVERERVQALAEALGYGFGGALPSDTTVTAVQLLGARYYLGGMVTALGDQSVRIDPELTRTDLETVVRLPDIAMTPENFSIMKTRIVAAFLEGMDIPVTDTIQRISQGMPTADFRAFLEFSKGLACEGLQLYPEAEAAYRTALEHDNRFYTARLRMEELHELNRLGADTLLALDGPTRQVLLDERVFPALPDVLTLGRLETIGALAGAGIAPGNDSRQPVEERRLAEERHNTARLPGPPGTPNP